MPRPRKATAEPSNSLIGARIKRFRLAKGLSQAQLADKIGVTRETITAYESGRARLLDDVILNLAKALSVSADEILGLKAAPKGDESSGIRFTRRLRELEQLPEQKRKAILKTLDDLIRANS